MDDKIRVGEQIELEAKDPDFRYGNAPEIHLWQAHVHEAEAVRTDATAPNDHHWAEEYAQVAMRGVQADENEFQLSEQRGDKHGIGEVSDEIASAGDIVGG